MGRGVLRIHLGAAPGVGETYAMLSEAHRWIERGTDCVVGFVEHHSRPRAEVMLHGLELVEPREIEYRGSTWQARERIVVGLTGGPEGRTLIRRAARLAEKGAGGEGPGRPHRRRQRPDLCLPRGTRRPADLAGAAVDGGWLGRFLTPAGTAMVTPGSVAARHSRTGTKCRGPGSAHRWGG